MNRKVTIITVVYNGVNEIEKTILSIITQIYKDIEYIIIDGGSSDGTIDIIKKYQDRITYWVSEPDKGIYDAMNKGINYATGKYLIFMNSGDIFANSSVVMNISKFFPHNYDVIYGSTNVNYRWGKYLVKPAKIKELNSRIPFCHQSAFVKVNLMKEKLFDLSYKFSADYNFFNLIYRENKIFYCYNGVVAEYDSIYGFSSRNSLLMHKDNLKISITNKSISKLGGLAKFIKINLINSVPAKLISIVYQVYFSINSRYKKL